MQHPPDTGYQDAEALRANYYGAQMDKEAEQGRLYVDDDGWWTPHIPTPQDIRCAYGQDPWRAGAYVHDCWLSLTRWRDEVHAFCRSLTAQGDPGADEAWREATENFGELLRGYQKAHAALDGRLNAERSTDKVRAALRGMKSVGMSPQMVVTLERFANHEIRDGRGVWRVREIARGRTAIHDLRRVRRRSREHRPTSRRRTAASSRTSSSDPGESDPADGSSPPQLRLRRTRYGLVSPNLLGILLHTEVEGVDR